MTETTAAAQVGENVRVELAKARKSQTWLAGVLAISQQSISSRLRGEIAFDVDELARVAKALDLDITVLMSITSESAQAS
jgi:plasmid maintenance system antidote protein VapI